MGGAALLGEVNELECVVVLTAVDGQARRGGLEVRAGKARGSFYWSLRIPSREKPMVRYAPNKMPAAVKRRYFELIRERLSGSEWAAAMISDSGFDGFSYAARAGCW